jgi:eukaryotic-like serine/threonine-protein kinase
MTIVAPNFPPIIASRYVPVRLIAKGGMGAVYEVEHARTGERLALKVLHSAVGRSDAELERFKREARASARIKSEHVVRVTDADVAPELDGAPFLVMELLEGADLERQAESRPVPPATVVEWLGQVARALDKAHRLGIVHRDLKPENLFLAQIEDQAPIVKILDFGIVKMMEDGARPTTSGQILGTPKYMAPEQASRQKPVTSAADRYALGLVAYRLLSGESYYHGDVLSIIAQLLHEPLQLPSERHPALGGAFDAWFLKACHRDPEARFTSAGQQIDELATAFGLPAVAGQAVARSGGEVRTSGWRRRGAVIAAGLTGAMLVGLVLHQQSSRGLSATPPPTSVTTWAPVPPQSVLPTLLSAPTAQRSAGEARSPIPSSSRPAALKRGSGRSHPPLRQASAAPSGSSPVPATEVPRAADPYADQK